MSVAKNPAFDIPTRSNRGHLLMHVTPEIAQRWLQYNRANRGLTPRRVDAYADAMARGEWLDNGQPVSFAPGYLLDGQHRLHAILKSGATVVLSVDFGLDAEAQVTIDAGGTRSPKDVLTIEGLSIWQARTFGTAIHSILHYLAGGAAPYTPYRYPNKDVRDFYLEHAPSVHETMEFIAALPRKGAVLAHARATTIHYLAARKHPDGSRDFFERLYSGENIGRTEPVLHLRRRLEAQRLSRGDPLTPYKATLYVVNALNAQLKGATWASSNSASLVYTRPDGRIVVGE